MAPTTPPPSQSLESFKSTSSGILLVGSFIVAFAIYLAQRGILVIAGDVNGAGSQAQGNYSGLNYSYATVSVLGPLVLAFLCVLLATMTEARCRAWFAYLKAGGDSDLPPWTIGSGNDRYSNSLRRWFKVAGALPLVAFIIHICAGARVVQMGVAELIRMRATQQIQQNGANVPEPETWIPVGLAMIVVCLVTLRSVREVRLTVTSLNLVQPQPSSEMDDKSG